MSKNTESKNNNKKKKCRIWWPEQLPELDPSSSPPSSLLLFGWVFNGGDSVDLVVASLIFDEIWSSTNQFGDLQETLNAINRTMPNWLKERALFTLIGQCKFSPQKHLNGQIKDGISETQRGIFVKSGTWAELVLCEMKKLPFGNKERRFLPVVESLRLDPDLFENCDCHIILFDYPVQGNNHYSLNNWGICKKTGTNLKKPKWILDLENKPSRSVSESVILALNCSNFAKSCIEKHAGINRRSNRSFFLAISDVLWNCVAFCVASVSTIIYIFIQLSHKLLTYKSAKSLLYIIRKIFPYSCENIQIRSSQFLYWPVFLQGTGHLSSNPNTEFNHKSSLKRHFIFSNILTNTAFGFLLSLLLLNSKTLISHQISTTSHLLTESLLRSGLVWLMGAPAGFKLNTELAKVFGTVALNVVQLYSAILYRIVGERGLEGGIVGLGIAGVVFGAGTMLGFLLDLVRIGGLHVAALHWSVSVVYGNQIRGMASLWRIFRGIKWNPLRHRLDTHTPSVEQHIVGSLIFSPLLLLLPTTSVFYVFFTILNTQIALVCYFLEVLISVLYVMPVWELVLWGLNRRVFPSGIWFENLLAVGQFGEKKFGEEKEVLVSLIRSNFATIGQVVGPHFKKIFCTVPSSFCKSLAYGVLSGQRIPSNLNTNLPPLIPWMDISFRNYWNLCYRSIIASRSMQRGEIKGQK
ncbi:hypothetical protein LUZ60_017487 [Juncus effusus]|nr:hypothetical protein LUZ60_017487 [Juncus effusus]